MTTCYGVHGSLVSQRQVHSLLPTASRHVASHRSLLCVVSGRPALSGTPDYSAIAHMIMLCLQGISRYDTCAGTADSFCLPSTGVNCSVRAAPDHGCTVMYIGTVQCDKMGVT